MRAYVPVLLSLLLFVGCATSRVAENTGSGTQVSSRSDSRSEEEGERTESEMVSLLVREATFLPEGELEEYTQYTYDEESLLLVRKERFDSSNTLFEKVVYEYEGGLRVRKTTYDAGDSVTSYHTYEYGDENRLIADTLYTGNEKLQTRSTYKYDEGGNRIRWNVYGQTETLLAYTVYTYQDGRVTRRDIFSASQRLDKFSTVKYDREGRKVQESYFYANGQLDRYVKFEYLNDTLAAEITYAADDSMLWKLSYEYDDHHRVRRITYVDHRGVIKEIKDREYAEYANPL
jgi:antitoxin component YwqK of YwqJK toxin-antitoxin module